MGVLSRALALALAVSSGAALWADASPPQVIRVGLSYGEGAPQTVVITGSAVFRAERSIGAVGKRMTITAGRGTLMFDGSGEVKSIGRWIEVSPGQGAAPLQLDGAVHRGDLRIALQDNGRLRVVNTLGLEHYLRGVVPNEMFPEDEAYQVQAVIARTYAMYVRDLEKKHHPDGFDICSTGHCQVYRGLDSETPMSDEAVAATNGLVLTRGGSVIFSAYHTNAGGQTVEVDEAWPGSIREAFLYLPRVESPYDVEAQRIPGYEWCYEWRRTVQPDALKARLGAEADRVGEIRDLLVLRRNRAGRVTSLKVVGRRGSMEIMGSPSVRAALDAPSTRFEITRSANGFALHGWGYGDGVGLSQHGALGMARAGYDHESILAHYYRGVKLTADYGMGYTRALRATGSKPRRATVPGGGRS